MWGLPCRNWTSPFLTSAMMGQRTVHIPQML
jgi:hypothetical protein